MFTETLDGEFSYCGSSAGKSQESPDCSWPDLRSGAVS